MDGSDGATVTTAVLIVAEQLRRRVPGGIGTYVRGLLQGVHELEAGGEPVPAVDLLSRRIPSPLLTRAWDRGLLGVTGTGGVVHATSFAFPSVHRRPLVVMVHDLAWRSLPEAYPLRSRRWHEAAWERALERATRFVVPSSVVAEQVVDAGAPAHTVTVIGEGCDHLPAPDHAARAGLLSRFGVAGPYLLTVGTLEPRKNLDRLFQGYAVARRSLPGPWPLVVVGPSGWGPRLTPVEGVVLVGPVAPPVLSALYADAYLFAYLPLLEGFGLPPLEAMRAGVPVLSSPVPSVVEVGHAGPALLGSPATGEGSASAEPPAWVVDPMAVDAIAEGFRILATDDRVRSAKVAIGREWAAARTWRTTARSHVRVWEQVA